MKDQIIDSIFSNVNKIADNISIKNKESIIDYVETDSSAFINNGTIQTNFKFTTKTFSVNKSKCVINIQRRSKNYLKSGGFDVGNTFTTSFNNLFIGEILVNTTDNPNHTINIVLKSNSITLIMMNLKLIVNLLEKFRHLLIFPINFLNKIYLM